MPQISPISWIPLLILLIFMFSLVKESFSPFYFTGILKSKESKKHKKMKW